MGSGPVCAMIWEGRDAVKTGRSKSPLQPLTPRHALTTSSAAILGATNPLASAPGTIRGDYSIDVVSTRTNSPNTTADPPTGPQRLPRLRQRRERQEGDCSLVQRGRGHQLEVALGSLDLREGLNQTRICLPP